MNGRASKECLPPGLRSDYEVRGAISALQSAGKLAICPLFAAALDARPAARSLIAQLVEQSTVNRSVAGSSPAQGAKTSSFKRLHGAYRYRSPEGQAAGRRSSCRTQRRRRPATVGFAQRRSPAHHLRRDRTTPDAEVNRAPVPASDSASPFRRLGLVIARVAYACVVSNSALFKHWTNDYATIE